MGTSLARARMVVMSAVMAVPLGLMSSGSASAATPIAMWNMNEGPNASVMLGAGGPNGAIAASAAVDGLTTGVNFGGTPASTGYRWGPVKPNVDWKPGRVIRIDDSRLNPGTRDWAISFRYRTTRPYGNIMQKGQSQAKGGQIKFQLPKGQVSCMFKGGNGERRSIKTVNSYDDGQWHVVRCVRTATRVTLTVDAGTPTVETRIINGSSGSISNTVPMTIGGKPNCNQVDITCDYFEGDIDWVQVESLP